MVFVLTNWGLNMEMEIWEGLSGASTKVEIRVSTRAGDRRSHEVMCQNPNLVTLIGRIVPVAPSLCDHLLLLLFGFYIIITSYKESFIVN